jgi:hypothetical protein
MLYSNFVMNTLEKIPRAATGMKDFPNLIPLHSSKNLKLATIDKDQNGHRRNTNT